MPTKTKRDEEKWQKAKEIAKEQGKAENYAYIMGIYKKMNPDYEFKNKDAVLSQRVAARHMSRSASSYDGPREAEPFYKELVEAWDDPLESDGPIEVADDILRGLLKVKKTLQFGQRELRERGKTVARLSDDLAWERLPMPDEMKHAITSRLAPLEKALDTANRAVQDAAQAFKRTSDMYEAALDAADFYEDELLDLVHEAEK